MLSTALRQPSLILCAESLFSTTASDGQKFRGFMVFQKFLQGAAASGDSAMISCLFSKNFLRCLMNQAAREDRYLHRAALKTLKTMEEIAASNPEMVLIMVACLLGKRGSFNFDQRTNSKSLEKVLQNVPAGSGERIISLLRERIAYAVK